MFTSRIAACLVFVATLFGSCVIVSADPITLTYDFTAVVETNRDGSLLPGVGGALRDLITASFTISSDAPDLYSTPNVSFTRGGRATLGGLPVYGDVVLFVAVDFGPPEGNLFEASVSPAILTGTDLSGFVFVLYNPDREVLHTDALPHHARSG